MPSDQVNISLLAYDRAMRGLDRLAAHDPEYWVADRARAVDVERIRVGDHKQDLVAQWWASLPGGDLDPDPYLAGLAALGIPLDEAADFGFAGPGDEGIALVQGIRVHTYRTDICARPAPPLSPRKDPTS